MTDLLTHEEAMALLDRAASIRLTEKMALKVYVQAMHEALKTAAHELTTLHNNLYATDIAPENRAAIIANGQIEWLTDTSAALAVIDRALSASRAALAKALGQ